VVYYPQPPFCRGICHFGVAGCAEADRVIRVASYILVFSAKYMSTLEKPGFTCRLSLRIVVSADLTLPVVSFSDSATERYVVSGEFQESSRGSWSDRCSAGL
jgi:hypothetical protein